MRIVFAVVLVSSFHSVSVAALRRVKGSHKAQSEGRPNVELDKNNPFNPNFVETINVNEDADSQIMMSNNYGNYMAKVAYILFKADQCGNCGSTTAMIDAGDEHGMMKRLFQHPLSILIGQQDAETCSTKVSGNACSHFPPRPDYESSFPKWDVTKQLFNKHLYPKLKNQDKLSTMREQLNDTLVVHLRGTDILTGMLRLNGGYTPAPCQYVHDVIERGNFKKIQIISEDANQPCISHIQARYPDAVYKHQSADEDVMTLMSAPNLALSTSSTFGLSSALMFPSTHKYLALPTFRGKGMRTNEDVQKRDGICCEAAFDEERLSEMCKISKGAMVYELVAPLEFITRKQYMLEGNRFSESVLHKCDDGADSR